MGLKYTSIPVTGFNATPPPDDGTEDVSNQVQWSKHINKIGSPLKTAVDSINLALLDALDQTATSITTSYNTVADDHLTTIEIASTATSGVIVYLGTAATLAAGYVVTVSNQSSYVQTISRVTSANGINGSAANISIYSKESICFAVNANVNGYNIVSRSRRNDVLSVKDFGAVGGGVTDDTAAWALAIASGAKEIHGVQGDTYLIGSSGINIANKTGVRLVGNGSIFKIGTASVLTDLLGHNVAILFDTCTNSGISGFKFDGNSKASDAISFNSCTDCFSLENIIYDAGDSPGAAITSFNSTRTKVNGNDISDCAFAGIWSGNFNNGQMDTDVEIIGNKVRDVVLSDGIVASSVGGRIADNYLTGYGVSGIIFGGGNGFSSKRLTIANNICTGGVAGFGIQFDVVYTTSADLPVNISITGNVCSSNAGGGIYAIYGTLVSICGNTCQDNGGDGITVDELANFTISGNTCRDTRAGGARTQINGIELDAQINVSGISNGAIVGNTCTNHTTQGIRLGAVAATDSIDNVSIVGNTCCDNGATGIIVVEATAGTVNAVSVVGNVCKNNTTSDMRIDPLNVSISGNLFSTITGATGSFNFTDLDATPSVKGGRKFFRCANTGATVITAFDDGFAGQEIVVWFTNANTTVTDGANILLAGAANFISSSDDTLSLIFDGTAWHETARSVN